MNTLDSYSAYNKLTKGLKIDNGSNVSEYILVSKIKKATNAQLATDRSTFNSMLSTNRVNEDEVVYRFFIKLEKLNKQNLLKIMEMFDINLIKTIRIVTMTPVSVLIKKKIFTNR